MNQRETITLGKALRFAKMAVQTLEPLEGDVEDVNGARLALQGAIVRLEALLGRP